MRRLTVIVLVATRIARADPPHASDIVDRPLVLDEHQLAAELVVELNVAEGDFGAPTSLAPDVWFGALPRLTVGLIHSNQSVDRIVPGASFCVRTDAIICDHGYHGSGIDVLWSAVAGQLAIAPRARLLVRSLGVHPADPFKPAVTLGAAIQWTSGRFAITGDPYLQLGLDNTDRGNRSAMFLPVAFAVQPTCRWAVELHTGWNSDLAVWRDGWHVPVEVGLRARATMHLDVTGALGFTSLLGPQNTPKQRVLLFGVGWRT